MAVLEGCKVINSRLEKFKKENPGGTWEDWVTAAFFARSSLLSHDYNDEVSDVDKDGNQGEPLNNWYIMSMVATCQ